MSISLEPIQPNIAVLKVQRPQVRNALDWQSMSDFARLVDQVHEMPGLSALIVTGTGQAFIAGGDLRELAGYPGKADGRRLSALMTAALARLESLPCPTIAAMDGPARGGGAEISLACDLRIMSETADIGFVQVKLELTPGWGAGQRLLRFVGYSRAMEWLLTGKVLSAKEAEACGLANQVVPAGEALIKAVELAQEFSGCSLDTVYAIKRLLRAGLSLPPVTAAVFEQNEFPALWAAKPHLDAVERFLRSK